MKKLFLNMCMILVMLIATSHVAQPMQVGEQQRQGYYERVCNGVKRALKIGGYCSLVVVVLNAMITVNCASDCRASESVECFVQCHEAQAFPFLKPDNDAMREYFAQYFISKV